jgi:hypothetical protein
MSRSVVVQNFRSTRSVARVAVGNLLLGNETEEVRLDGTLLNECLIRVVSAVQTEGSSSDGVVGIIICDIICRGQFIGTNNVLEGMTDVQRITKSSSNHAINVFAIGETSSKSIERSVFLDQDNDILDVILP